MVDVRWLLVGLAAPAWLLVIDELDAEDQADPLPLLL
jgi:hypothetical protein